MVSSQGSKKPGLDLHPGLFRSKTVIRDVQLIEVQRFTNSS